MTNRQLFVFVESNGLHAWLIDFVDYMSARDIQISLVTLQKKGQLHEYLKDRDSISTLSLQSNFIQFIKQIIRIWRSRNAQIYVLGHKPMILATFINCLLRIRLTFNYVQQTDYFTMMRTSSQVSMKIKGVIHERISFWYLKRADSIQSVSLDTYAKLLSVGVRKNRIFHCALGVDFDRLERTLLLPLMGPFDFSTFSPFILSIGRLVQEKRHDFTIKVFQSFHAIFPDYHLVIVGEGPLRKHLDNLIVELNLQKYVHLIGWQEAIGKLLTNCSIFIHSAYTEGYASVQAEARYFDTHIVSTPTGVALDLFHSGDSLIEIAFRDTIEGNRNLWLKQIESGLVHKRSPSRPPEILKSHATNHVFYQLFRHFQSI